MQKAEIWQENWDKFLETASFERFGSSKFHIKVSQHVLHLFCFRSPINDLPREISQHFTCASPSGQRKPGLPNFPGEHCGHPPESAPRRFPGTFLISCPQQHQQYNLLNPHEWENPQKRSSNQQLKQRREGLGSFLPWVRVGFMLGFRLACRP